MNMLGTTSSLVRITRLIAAAGLTACTATVLADDHGAAKHATPSNAHAPAPSNAHAPAAPTTKPAGKAAEKPSAKNTGAAPTSPGVSVKKKEAPAAETTPAETEAPTNSRTSTQTASGTTSALENTEGLSAADALKLLTEGNARWVATSPNTPNTSMERRKAVADHGQHPFVTVLTCADSRLPVERIFDRGVGDVFVVRVAGNIAGTSETGTIEYGVEHLKTPLLVIMGHTKCGAVNAAATHAEVGGSIAKIVDQIEPAVERAAKNNPGVEGANLVPAAIKENVWQTAFDLLKNSHEVRSLVESGKLKIIGAVCDISTDKVEWMGEHPWQKELISAFNAEDRAHTPVHADAEATNAAGNATQNATEAHH
jgi:carbonic anhydrase